MFEPNPNLSDEINSAIAESELAGGVYVNKLVVGRELLVRTKNTLYTIERREDGLYIFGDQMYCPAPVKCAIAGSNFGGSMLKMGFIGRGMYMEFSTSMHPEVIVTSQIMEITEL